MVDTGQHEWLLLHGAAGAALGSASMPRKHSTFSSNVHGTGEHMHMERDESAGLAVCA
jgi:hypothetical protein